jgi:hypothetical protein
MRYIGVYETKGEFPDYLICCRCGGRVERGIFNVSSHSLECSLREHRCVNDDLAINVKRNRFVDELDAENYIEWTYGVKETWSKSEVIEALVEFARLSEGVKPKKVTKF